MPAVLPFLTSLLIPLSSYYFYTRFLQSSVNNDLSIYNNVDWWNESESPFVALLRSNAVRVPFFTKHFPRLGGDNASISVLDIGCGGGYLAEALARFGYNVTGIDISESSIANARTHANEGGMNINYQVGSILAIPFPNQSFDVVVASDVLEHIGDVPLAIAEISRVLKPSGVFVFDCVNRNWKSFSKVYLVMQELLGVIPKGTHDWKLFVTPAEMKRMLVSNGFLTDDETWKGRQWNTSVEALVKTGRAGYVQGMYVDDDLSGFYMGFAVKEEE